MNISFRNICLLALAVLLLPAIPSVAQNNDVARDAMKFEQLLQVVDRRYVDTVNTNALVEHAIKGMLKEMDPHSVYISKEDLQRMNEPLKGNFEGIGVQFNIFKDTILVVSAIADGPSEKLGIRSGDRIIEIEGKNFAGTGVTNKDVVDQLRGEKGTKVKVGIKRSGEKKLLDFTIERDKIPIYSITSTYMATDDIGYIKLNRFSATSMKEFHEGLEKLQKSGMKHLILDLRGNGGGYLKTAIDLADEFLETKKMIVYTEGRSYARSENFSTVSGNFESGKLVVLIDEGSASASEIVSGAVQDHDRGLIIGRRSFGKGLVQKPFALADGSAIRLTVSRYYTPSGRCIQKPYEEGVSEYRNDIKNRYESGELMHLDSIDIPDSLLFETINIKRPVYGGGGIMPDIFVPLDTSLTSKYYKQLQRKGVIYDFAINELDRNRKAYEKQYSKEDKFMEEFAVSEELMTAFLAHAESKGVEMDQEGFDHSRKLIETMLMAQIGRSLFNTSMFYQVSNPISPAYQKAISVIQDGTFDEMKLVYK